MRSWYRIGKMVGGFIYGDNMLDRKDGQFLYTALIKEWEDCKTFHLVKTERHLVYILWESHRDLSKDNSNV